MNFPFFSRMFPGTNLQDLNLDWICRRIMELSKGIIAPYINPANHHWMQYNTSTEEFEDSGVSAEGDASEPNIGVIPRGSTVAIIGDSMSTCDGFPGNVPGYEMWYPRGDVDNYTKTWWWMLCNSCGATIIVNAAYSGSRVTNTAVTRPSFCDRVGQAVIGSPQVVIVELGGNDYLHDVPLGDYDYDTATESLSEATFRTAYIKGMKMLRERLPNAYILAVVLGSIGAEYQDSMQNICAALNIACVNVGDYTRVLTLHADAAGMRLVATRANIGTDFGFATNMLFAAQSGVILDDTTSTFTGFTVSSIRALRYGKLVICSVGNLKPAAQLTSWVTIAQNLPTPLYTPDQYIVSLDEITATTATFRRKLQIRMSGRNLQVKQGEANAAYTGIFIYIAKDNGDVTAGSASRDITPSPDPDER